MPSYSQSSGGAQSRGRTRGDGAPRGRRVWPAAGIGADDRGKRLESPHVLVVDDDVDSATALAAFLETLGCEVEIAHDGFAALEAAREHRPDAIFLDIGMPGLDGDEVCRRLRREPWGRHMLIAAATAFATSRHRERSFRAGFDHYLVKPLDLRTVSLLVRDL